LAEPSRGYRSLRRAGGSGPRPDGLIFRRYIAAFLWAAWSAYDRCRTPGRRRIRRSQRWYWAPALAAAPFPRGHRPAEPQSTDAAGDRAHAAAAAIHPYRPFAAAVTLAAG